MAREEVPPPASPLDWILKAAAAKVEVVKAAIEAQVGGWEGQEVGGLHWHRVCERELAGHGV